MQNRPLCTETDVFAQRYATRSAVRATIGLVRVIVTPPAPVDSAEYCDERVCLSVCLSVRDHISGTARPRFLCTLPTAVARSSSGGVLIRYVFPIL